MTDPIKRAAERHYDYDQGLCGADDASDRGRSAPTSAGSGAAPPTSSSSTRTAPPTSDPSSGDADVARRLADGVSAKQPADPGLCERRLRTNDLLCKVLGGAVAFRAPGAAKILSGAIAGECVHAWKWLEENAPGGACGKD